MSSALTAIENQLQTPPNYGMGPGINEVEMKYKFHSDWTSPSYPQGPA